MKTRENFIAFLNFLFIQISILIAGNTISAQTIQNSGTSNYLYDIFFIDENTGWIVGGSGTILKTTDGGEHWEQKTYNNQTQFIYMSVYFTNKDTGWIAGSDGFVDYGADERNCILLKTVDGGESWQENPFNGQCLSNIQFKNDSLGWILQTLDWRHEKILKTSDGGISWMSQFEKSPYEGICGLFFSDYNNGWAIGHDNVYKTVDSGENWLEVLQSSEALQNLFFLNDSVGWISYESGFYKTTNSGVTWNTHNTLLHQGWRPGVIRFVNENIGIIATDYNGGSLYTTVDGGETFNFYYASNIYKIFLFDIYNCWAIGKDGKILKFSLENYLTKVNVDNKKQNSFSIVLYQNCPNPFNHSTTFHFSQLKSEHVSLKIYNPAGQQVATLVDEIRTAGEHQVQWQADGLPDGIYFAKLQCGTSIATRKLIFQ